MHNFEGSVERNPIELQFYNPDHYSGMNYKNMVQRNMNIGHREEWSNSDNLITSQNQYSSRTGTGSAAVPESCSLLEVNEYVQSYSNYDSNRESKQSNQFFVQKRNVSEHGGGNETMNISTFQTATNDGDSMDKSFMNELLEFNAATATNQEEAGFGIDHVTLPETKNKRLSFYARVRQSSSAYMSNLKRNSSLLINGLVIRPRRESFSLPHDDIENTAPQKKSKSKSKTKQKSKTKTKQTFENTAPQKKSKSKSKSKSKQNSENTVPQKEKQNKANKTLSTPINVKIIKEPSEKGYKTISAHENGRKQSIANMFMSQATRKSSLPTIGPVIGPRRESISSSSENTVPQKETKSKTNQTSENTVLQEEKQNRASKTFSTPINVRQELGQKLEFNPATTAFSLDTIDDTKKDKHDQEEKMKERNLDQDSNQDIYLFGLDKNHPANSIFDLYDGLSTIKEEPGHLFQGQLLVSINHSEPVLKSCAVSGNSTLLLFQEQSEFASTILDTDCIVQLSHSNQIIIHDQPKNIIVLQGNDARNIKRCYNAIKSYVDEFGGKSFKRTSLGFGFRKRRHSVADTGNSRSFLAIFDRLLGRRHSQPC